MSHDTGSKPVAKDDGPDALDKIMLWAFLAAGVIIAAVVVWAIFFRG